MFIFISRHKASCVSSYSFTFHYVYIYIPFLNLMLYYQNPLHSTMFIFIFAPPDKPLPYRLLYIPLCLYLYENQEYKSFSLPALHSTMFIFISCTYNKSCFCIYLYIPLCLYLYCLCSEKGSTLLPLHSTMFIFISGLPLGIV